MSVPLWIVLIAGAWLSCVVAVVRSERRAGQFGDPLGCVLPPLLAVIWTLGLYIAHLKGWL